jgi:hypothetical protein
MVRITRSIAHAAIRLAAISVVSATFGLNDGRLVFAHGEAEPEAAKPAEAKPLPPALPPRPTEYPRGLNQKPRPGEAAAPPAAASDHAGPAQELKPAHDQVRSEQKMPEVKPVPSAARQQAMPSEPGGSKPGDGGAPAAGAAPEANDAAPKPVLWAPPKRYHFVMDTFTGLALGGNDPVAFFVDGHPRLGSPDHELDWGGTTWQFLNEGNLDAFKQNPEIYAPRFGGRCAYALSQGLYVEGMPQFFVIHRDRLYLFANAGYRAAFLTNPDALADEAARQWPILTRGQP